MHKVHATLPCATRLPPTLSLPLSLSLCFSVSPFFFFLFLLALLFFLPRTRCFSSLYSDILFTVAGEYHTDASPDQAATPGFSLVTRARLKRNPGTQQPTREEKPRRGRSCVGESDSESRFAGLKPDTKSAVGDGYGPNYSRRLPERRLIRKRKRYIYRKVSGFSEIFH